MEKGKGPWLLKETKPHSRLASQRWKEPNTLLHLINISIVLYLVFVVCLVFGQGGGQGERVAAVIEGGGWKETWQVELGSSH